MSEQLQAFWLEEEQRVAEMHASDLYDFDAVADSVANLASIGESEERLFQTTGILKVDEVFDPASIAAAKTALSDLVTDNFQGIQYGGVTAAELQAMTTEQRLDSVRKFWNIAEADPRFSRLATDPALLAVVSRLLGGAKPYMFQNGALVKPPQQGREKPWHQDLSYFSIPEDTPVVAIWLALDPATPENGCMRVIEGQGNGGLAPIPHFQVRDWQICDRDFRDLRGQEQRPRVLAAPLAPGGGLFFSGLAPHGTPHNNSGQRRRAVQLWWCPEDAPHWEPAERQAVWGGEARGQDVGRVSLAVFENLDVFIEQLIS